MVATGGGRLLEVVAQGDSAADEAQGMNCELYVGRDYMLA